MEVKTKTVSPVVGMPEVPHAEITVAWDKDACTAKIRSVLGNAAEQVGLLLLEAKQNLPHGTFQAYCEEEFPEIHYRTLVRWMDKALEDKSDTASLLSSSIVQAEQAKLEAMKSAAPGELKEPAKLIQRQEAKIEKLITKMSPPPVSPVPPQPAIKQTEPEDRPPRPSMAHTWDPFSREWYKPRPACPGVEGVKHGEYRWSEQSQAWFQIHAPGQQQAKVETPYLDKRENAQFELARAFTIVLHTDTPEARKAMKQFFSTAFHSDNGKVKKDDKLMATINHALTTLERK